MSMANSVKGDPEVQEDPDSNKNVLEALVLNFLCGLSFPENDGGCCSSNIVQPSDGAMAPLQRWHSSAGEPK